MQPKALILNLLRVHATVIDVRDLLRAGELFGIESGTIRVALSRLSTQGLVEPVARGRWRMARAAAPLAGEVDAWRTLEERVRPWHCDWVGVATGGLSDARATLRTRRRALDLIGFRTFRPGLEIRPNNLREPLRERLHALGVEAPVLAIGELGADQKAAEALWDRDRLAATYAAHRTALATSTAKVPTLSPPEAARETWNTGGAAIRTLALDPRLPRQMVDVEARRALATEMRAFDLLGRRVWRHVLNLQEVSG
ncbi:MAG: hypothetical protein AAGA48_37355 [Myxococcota bacterium]